MAEVSSTFSGNSENLLDRDFSSNFSFSPEDEAKKIILDFSDLVKISGFFVRLAEDTYPPEMISVRGDFGDGNFRNILDGVGFQSGINFQKSVLKRLEISFVSDHLLTIGEIKVDKAISYDRETEVIFFGFLMWRNLRAQ